VSATREPSSVITRLSIATIGEIAIRSVFDASGMLMVGCCATSSPDAENDMSRKITRTIKKSMNGMSGI
jgi:hypothetical protein